MPKPLPPLAGMPAAEVGGSSLLSCAMSSRHLTTKTKRLALAQPPHSCLQWEEAAGRHEASGTKTSEHQGS